VPIANHCGEPVRRLYEKPSKQEREDSFFKTFLLLEKNIPAGQWKRHEAPDYLLKISDVTVGLEITSLINSDLAVIRDDHYKAFAMAQSAASKQNLPIMEVQAEFRDEHSLIDAKEAAIELVGVITRNLPSIDDTKNHVLNGFNGNYYSTIMVNLGTRNGKKWLDSHRWHCTHMNWVRQNPIDDLQKSINKKDAKLPDYLRSCRECWLLIGVDEWTAAEAVYFSARCLEHDFECGFTRAYFLRNIEGKLSRLKIK
jgi:hypothetical protein